MIEEKRKNEERKTLLLPVLLGRRLGHEAERLVLAPRLSFLGEAAEGEGGHFERVGERRKEGKKRERID